MGQHPLYWEESPENRSKGRLLWLDISNVVMLTQSQRHSDDPVYAKILQRVRLGKATDSDLAAINSRCVPTTNQPSPANLIDYLGSSTLCCFPKHSLVKQYNNLRINAHPDTHFTFYARHLPTVGQARNSISYLLCLSINIYIYYHLT